MMTMEHPVEQVVIGSLVKTTLVTQDLQKEMNCLKISPQRIIMLENILRLDCHELEQQKRKKITVRSILCVIFIIKLLEY